MAVHLPDIQQLTASSRDLPAAQASQTSIALKPSGSNISVALSDASSSSSVAGSRHLLPLSSSGSRLRFGGRVPPSSKIASQSLVWEDLMAMDTEETPGKHPPAKYKPPWQQTLTRDSLQIHLNDQKRNKKIRDTKSRIAVLTTDPSVLVSNFHEFVAQTREKVHRKTLQELEKLESCRLQKFQLIFHGLKTVNEIPEKYFPRMRKLLGKTKTEYTTDWYSRLGEEAESQHPPVSHEVSDLLKKLKQFVYHQPTDLPLYREKICLLTLSIPADELCRPAWQSAMIFVMVRVLEWRLEVLKFWLGTRHLYLLQYIEEDM